MGPTEKGEIATEMGVEAEVEVEVEVVLYYEMTILMFRLVLEEEVQVCEAWARGV